MAPFLYALILPYQILTDFHNYFTVKCLKSIENKMTSVTTHFKKLTTGNNVFIVSVIV